MATRTPRGWPPGFHAPANGLGGRTKRKRDYSWFVGADDMLWAPVLPPLTEMDFYGGKSIPNEERVFSQRQASNSQQTFTSSVNQHRLGIKRKKRNLSREGGRDRERGGEGWEQVWSFILLFKSSQQRTFEEALAPALFWQSESTARNRKYIDLSCHINKGNWTLVILTVFSTWNID